MSKNFKLFNQDTKEWDIIATGNAANITSHNPRFLNGKNTMSADEVFNVLDDKIESMRGNIAWLAQYGGGGGGGGGEGGIDATITLTNGDIKQQDGINVMYLSTKSVDLEYLITAKKVNQKYLITVTLDGSTVINNQEGWSGTPGRLSIKDITKFSKASTHSIVVTASDSDGMSTTPYTLSIIESSISIDSSTKGSSATIGLKYDITYSIVNKVLGADTTLIVTNITNGVSKSYDLGKFTTTQALLYNVDFFSLFTDQATTGSSYTIEAYAQTSIDGRIIESNKISNKVVVEDGETLVVLVDGCTTQQDIDNGLPRTKFTSGGNISFAFTPYLSNVRLIYYAVRLTNSKGISIPDIGIFEPSGEEGDKYSNNPSTLKGVAKTFSWSINSAASYLGDYTITLRCWSEKGDPMVDTTILCTVIESTTSLIPDQNPNNSMFANWDIKNNDFPQLAGATKWTSMIAEFTNPGELEAHPNNVDMDVRNTNGILSGFLMDNNQPKLRLVGESYAVIHTQPFKAPTDDNDNWSKLGFSFSVAFKTDPHPFSDRTVFSCGDFTSNGEFSQGLRVTLEEAVWTYLDGNIQETISCKLQQDVLNIVDFVADIDNSEIKIFVNGVLNVAREIKSSYRWQTNSEIYIACDNINGTITNFADVNIYNIKLFRRALNDKQLVINALNTKAKSNLLHDGTVDYSEYNTWKARNFFSTSDNNPTTLLWDDFVNGGTYANLNFQTLVSDTNRKPPLPVVYIDCGGSGFTKDVFEKIGANKEEYNNCTFNYFDPNSVKGTTVSTSEMSVQIQGTSSTGYRSKNLEIKFNKALSNSEGEYVGNELFQPKDTWMPENQFTLKADVVDSAHANNAAIGKWINDNADAIFDKTPPMQELEAHRPVDSYDPSKVHNKVTIKHTLEGFPVILLIKFDKSDIQEMLGIYSFNLGRNAYFNMGFKFFKNFSIQQKDGGGSLVENTCPAFTSTYELYKPTELFGKIDQRQIYSYEFSENANLIPNGDTMQPTALFWQDDLSIIKHVGEFRYNGANGDNSNVTDESVWERLKLLFTNLAEMTSVAVDKYIWDVEKKSYKKGVGKYAAQTSFSTLAASLDNKISLKNAYSYFVICVAFGLVDSLGKNMTLRSWNVGGSTQDATMNKWWPCFYDMDTANGLSNTGEENVPKTSYIDTFRNAKVEAGVNSLEIIRNSADGGYDTYSSRLWDVLRDVAFTNTGVYQGGDYNSLWRDWRNGETLLKSPEYFIDNYFGAQTKDCGELIYNYDYKVKYLTKYQKDIDTPASYANIEFLHGTRLNYVRDWLSKRYFFMDGVFMYDNPDNIYPYNEKGAFKCGGAKDSNPSLIVRSGCPLIFTVNIGQSATGDVRYFVPENTPTKIVMMPFSSFNTQITINGMSQLNELEGLKNINFQGFMNTLRLTAFAELDIAGVNTLSTIPIDFNTAFINSKGYSDVRHINLSNTSFWVAGTDNSTFAVNVEKYSKLKSLNIASSCVTSLSLPNASLSELNVTYSTITSLTLEGQSFIDNIDLTGCSKLTELTVSNCPKITSLTLHNMPNLTTVNIIGCSGLKSFTCTNNSRLTSVSISNTSALTNIDLSGCSNKNISLYLVGADNLENLNLKNVTAPIVVELADELPKLKTLNLYASGIKGFQYGNKPVAKYKNEVVADLSPLKTLVTLDVRSYQCNYLKFDNNPNKGFPVGTQFFKGCSAKRIFGHLNITNGNQTFSECPACIHELPEDTVTPWPSKGWYGSDTSQSLGQDEWEANINLDTNITISTTSLYYCFEGSGVNLFDVYYIMSKAATVTSCAGTFAECTKVQTSVENPLNRNLFTVATKVSDISDMFYSTPINGVLVSPENDGIRITKDNGLLSPIIGNLTSIDLFVWNSSTYSDSFLYSHSSKKTPGITKMRYVNTTTTAIKDSNKCYNAKAVTSDDYGYIDMHRVLSQFPNITYIEKSFYHDMEFTTAEYQNSDKSITYCNVFYDNPKLYHIEYSFLGKAKGSMIYIFGGNAAFDNDTNHFPQKLAKILYSFRFTDNVVYLPIHNEMFRKCKNTLEYITGYNTQDSYSGTSFLGGNKQYLKETPQEEFCYDIFKGCTKLKHICGLMYGLNSSTPINIKLPHTMFEDLPNLTMISYLFAYFGSNISYTLTSKGFKNCKLVNVQYAFAATSGNNCLHGSIPYGLFYQSTQQTKTIKNAYSDTDASSLGIDENFGISGGQWVPDEELSKPLPTAKTYTFNVTVPVKTINNMDYLFTRNDSIHLEPYTCNTGDLTKDDYGDVLVENDKFNNIKYLKNPNYSPEETIPNPNYDSNIPDSQPTIPNPKRDIRRIILNPDYSPYRYNWNVYAVDGTSGFEDKIKNSALYASALSKEISVSPEFPDMFFDANDKRICANPDSYPNQAINNYLCAPDLFYYCANNSSTKITYVFGSCGISRKSESYDYTKHGIRGRIPRMLFIPVNKITSLEGIFYYCPLISPYHWNDTTGNGKLFSTDMLYSLTNLTNLTAAFACIGVPNKVVIDVNTFSRNINLQSLDRTFMNSYWEENELQQLPPNLFSQNRSLTNIRGIFSAEPITVNGASSSMSTTTYYDEYGPKIVDSNLFTKDIHRNIQNLSYCFGNIRYAKGTVPEFWTWLNALPLDQRKTPFIYMSKEKIRNSSSIPEVWNAGML